MEKNYIQTIVAMTVGLALRRIGINPEWGVAKQEFIGKEQGQEQWID